MVRFTNQVKPNEVSANQKAKLKHQFENFKTPQYKGSELFTPQYLDYEHGTLQLVNTSPCSSNSLGHSCYVVNIVDMEKNIRPKAIGLRNPTFTAKIWEGCTTPFARLFPAWKSFVSEHFIKIL